MQTKNLIKNDFDIDSHCSLEYAASSINSDEKPTFNHFDLNYHQFIMVSLLDNKVSILHILLLTHFYWWVNQSSESLSKCPKVTQLESGKVVLLYHTGL